jgi:hypothetical protein
MNLAQVSYCAPERYTEVDRVLIQVTEGTYRTICPKIQRGRDLLMKMSVETLWV